MSKIFAILCIVGCTLAEEKPISPAAETRNLKTRQIDPAYHGVHPYVDSVHPVHQVVDYVHEPHIVGSSVTYIEPVVNFQEQAGHFHHPIDHYGIHTPNFHQIYSYVPSVGYGHHPFSYGQHSTVGGHQATASSTVSFTPGSGQIASSVQAGTGQTGLQSRFPVGTQQSSFTRGNQQSGLTQQSGAQQQTENSQGVAQPTQLTETQQADNAQSVQSSGNQQSSGQQTGRIQYGFLHSGFGQQQQFGIVQSSSDESEQTGVALRFGQRQEAANDQSGNQQGFGTPLQSGSSQQPSFPPSTGISTVASARTQSSSSQSGTQQSGGSPVTSMTFNSPVFGYSSSAETPSVRLIQPYNLSPSYAIHGFRNFQSGSSGASSTSGSEADATSGQQSSFTGSQQFSPISSGFQFDQNNDQSSGSQSGSSASFRNGANTVGTSGIEYSFTSQQSPSQPSTIRSGAQGSSQTNQETSSDGQGSGLAAFHSSYFRSGEGNQASSGSSQGSAQTQPQPAILRMSNDLSYDGSFNYGFESENGISSSASGSVRSIDPDHSAQVISGSYSYTAPDGTPIATNFYADETGFHAQGAHLPTAPPLPEYVARTIQSQQTESDQVQPTIESN